MTAILGHTLRVCERLTRRSEYEAVYRFGRRAHGRYLTIHVLPNGRPWSRVGIVATRRLGGAVIRNRARRLGRELFRLNKPAVAVDLVIMPKAPMIDASFQCLQTDYRAVLARAIAR